jgi:Xaa-Pro aminopeptidase
MNSRIQRLAAALPENTDGILITSRVNRYYFTGMISSAGTLLVTHQDAVFIIDFRYYEDAKRIVKDAEVVLQDNLNQQILKVCRDFGVKKLAIETGYLSVGGYNDLCEALQGIEILRDDRMNNEILKLRRNKDADEVASLREAQRIGDLGFSYICDIIKPGMTETEVALELDYYVRKSGAKRLYPDMIVASGVRSSLPHGEPTDNVIKAGDLLTLDFGVMFNGYYSDMTRTVGISFLGDEERKIYDLVLKAQLAALDAIQVNRCCADIDKVARDIIYNAGYQGCFGHGLGHSTGLENHENPRFNEISTDTCQVGDVMTVEPGIYLEGRFGCRIEDMVYIGENGVENLTHSPKELIIL